jgi:hypothetical protein
LLLTTKRDIPPLFTTKAEKLGSTPLFVTRSAVQSPNSATIFVSVAFGLCTGKTADFDPFWGGLRPYSPMFSASSRVIHSYPHVLGE